MQLKYNAPVAKVWQAITDSSAMKHWYFDIRDFQLQEGAVFNFYEPGGKNQFYHQCKIIEIIPLKKFQHTWAYPQITSGETLITWELVEVGSKTQLQFSHQGIECFAACGDTFAFQQFEAGWQEILEKSLKNYVET
ncbi:MAG: SRPBCC domain-containing protein [Niabella sp.]